jgi:tight adherence protein C
MPDAWITAAAVAAGAGFVAFGFALFMLVPLGRPTVHLVPDSRQSAAPPAPSRRASLTGIAPSGYVRWIERQIVYAGRAGEWSASVFLGIKVVVAIPGVLFGLLVTTIASHPFWVVLGVFATVLALIAPDVILYSRADDRRLAIQRALPDTLDQMTIAVEAGLGFDSAMARRPPTAAARSPRNSFVLCRTSVSGAPVGTRTRRWSCGRALKTSVGSCER